MSVVSARSNDGQRAGSMSQAARVSASVSWSAERPDDADDVGVLEEDQLAVAVVVGERTERLGSEGDLLVELEMVVEQ